MQSIEIPLAVNKKRFWVARADGGRFFDEFIEKGFIALAHLDDIKINEEKISAQTLQIFSDKSPPGNSRNSKYHQVRKFISDVKIEDWVITITKNSIAVGVIKSDAYLNGSGFPQKDYFLGLRRNVTWGDSFKRTDIPSEIKTALLCNQSFFNIDKHRESIYHLLFPFFILDGNLHTTLKIKTNKKIQTKDIINIFQIIDLIDENHNQSHKPSYVKAEFRSPGEIFAIFNEIKSSTPAWLLSIVTLYIFIFGNKWSGFDGIIDVESRRKIIEFILKKSEKNEDPVKSINELEIQIPDDKFTKIISKSEKKKIDPKWDI